MLCFLLTTLTLIGVNHHKTQSSAFFLSPTGTGTAGTRTINASSCCTSTAVRRKASAFTSSIIQVPVLHQSFDEYQSQALKRRNITLPLLDLTSSTTATAATSSNYKHIITPLPSSHLPTELSTLHIYGMQLKAAIHKMMIDDTLSKFTPSSSTMGSSAFSFQDNVFTGKNNEPTYGHLIGKPSSSSSPSKSDATKDNYDNSVNSSLIGCIGCAAEIILSTPSNSLQIETILEDVHNEAEEYSDFSDPLNDGNTEDSIITVLTKGSFRFIVKDVIQTFPYPIAIVDELLDDSLLISKTNIGQQEQEREQDKVQVEIQEDTEVTNDDEDDDDDTYDMYAHLSPSELYQRTLSAMKAIVDQKLETKPKTMSPLELSILEDKGMSVDSALLKSSIQQDQAEEMAAIFDIFTSSILDIAPSQTQRFFAVAMLAAEFGGLDNDIRNEILLTTDGVDRLRIVLEALEKRISFVQAKKLTQDIVEKSDESSKQLKVGKPTIPEWAKKISKGTKIEYYWSEQDGWLSGTIIETAMIIDELILTVLFDDGETVRLPFDPEEKVRWRPAGM